MQKKRLLYIVNDLPFFLSHRLALAKAASKEGFEVHIATPQGTPDLESIDAAFTFHTIPLSRKGKNPVKELFTIIAIHRLLQKLKPDMLTLASIKPVLYGGLMARLLKVPAVVVMVSGLGAVFVDERLLGRIFLKGIKKAYRFALRHKNLKVIFQNEDDRQVLLKAAKLPITQTRVIKGSGVDVNKYTVIPENKSKIVVMMVARLLKDKGVMEYVAAAKKLKTEGVVAQFLLIGDSDYENPAFIEDKYLDQFREEAYVELLGYREDIPQLMAQANIVVLPSYREGLSNVLIQAASCARAVVTTDVPGCRDAILHNQTGLLVPVKDVNALSTAIKWLIENPDEREKFGKKGRELAEAEFAIEKIVAAQMQVYRELVSVQ